jgi:uncharacterized protein DUF6647
MNNLLTAIVVWLSSNFGLPATFDNPRIEFVPSVEMTALRYKGMFSARNRELTALRNQPVDVNGGRQVVAIYNDAQKVIYLPEGWTGRTPSELSILVHEVVHHLQNLAGITYDCPHGRESLAYEAQDKWLGLFGRSLGSEFGIDGLTLLVTNSCLIGMIDPP